MSDDPVLPPEEPTVPPPPPGGSMHPLAVGCIGISTFAVVLIMVFVTVAANNASWHVLGLWVLAVALLIAARVRTGPSPALSAIAVGAAVAVTIIGGCLALITGGGRIGG